MDRRVVLDFDDLCDTNDPFTTLRLLKTRDPNFKVTLFAIPTRCGPALLAEYEKERDWIELGVHGWRHARHECLAWTSEETVEKLGRARELYPAFSNVFKAPNWETCDELYAGCKQSGFAVADHMRNIEILPDDSPNYIYNLRLRDDRFIRMHGHIQDWAGTGLTENANGSVVNEQYLLPVGTEYAFVSEAVSPTKALAKRR